MWLLYGFQACRASVTPRAGVLPPAEARRRSGSNCLALGTPAFAGPFRPHILAPLFNCASKRQLS
jgi:hypothetical protein